jgi:uncharacterized protein (TIGR03663 family)
MERVESQSIFDRPLADILRLTWEKVAYVVIFAVAVITRFWDLGARAMSHDESLHALYSYYLYNGTGYAHNPMMHGPFLFHANALIYFLFGDSDYTARVVPAIFGVALVMSPLLLKPWLGRLGALFTSIMLLISPAILYHSRYIRDDIYMALWVVLLIAALFHLLRSHRPGWLIFGGAVLMLALTTMENAYIFGYIGLAYILFTILWERASKRAHLWLYLAGMVVTAGLVFVLYLLNRPGTADAAASNKLATAILVALTGTIPIGLFSATIIRSREGRTPTVLEALRGISWKVWVVTLVVMFLIYSLLFTTFFTNPAGMITGIFGSISYWLAQQEVKRGDQPWYYYLLTLTMYEFLPFLIGIIAIIYYVIRGVPPEPDEGGEPPRDGEAVAAARPVYPTQSLFLSFLVFWTLMTLFMYSWAGERMAWLTVHPALAFIFLSGKFLGELAERVDWREVWRRGGALLALLLPITLFGLYTLLTKRPFQGLSIFKLQETGNWLAALVITLVLLALLVLVVRRLGRLAVPATAATLLLLLVALTVRTAWRFAYITYDYATELMVFAHGTPDVTRTMNEIADISRRTVGDKQIKVAYDSDVSWPLEWYMREYPNRVFYGENPSRENVDVPIVLAGDKDDDKVRPYLGDRYYRFKRRLVWWPTYDYRDLTLKRIWDILSTPEKRKTLWDILYWRKYPRSTDDWYYVHNFYMYVRKDVAQQMWGFGGVPPEALEPTVDPYAQAYIDLPATTSWGQVGTGNGQFNRPRGIAIGPDGDVYVVDSDNALVQVFRPDGTFVRQWGGHCNLSDGTDCQDPDGSGPLAPGDGQFQEPWGIAVDKSGRVYVADTWNHRIEVFESDGTFVTQWGTFGQVPTAEGGEDVFYGPRDVAVDDAGRVFVSDTGNKRIVVFDSTGSYLAQWGGSGATPGSFEEPVGLALDADGNLYVADTWNQRVQVFDAQFNYVREWPVNGWLGQGVLNKPYLDVDGQGRVYVTDPEGYRVIVFDGNGQVVATFGRYGYEANAFALPTGIALDSGGYIYVTDPDGQKVVKFEPVP